MKTLYTLAFLCVLSAAGLQAQRGIAYYDALALSAAYELQQGQLPLSEDVRAILAPYFADGSFSAEALSENPFLRGYFLLQDSVALKLQADAEVVLQQERQLMQAALPGLSGLEVTKLTAGLSQFMIERAREELTVAFFERFRRLADRNPEFGALFPTTTQRLGRLLDFPYAEMLPALRAAFQTDLERLIFRFDNFFRLPDYRQLLEELPEIEVLIKALRIAQQLESGQNPLQLLAELERLMVEELGAEPRFQNLQTSIQLSNLFVQSLRSLAPGSSLVSFQELSLLTADRTALDFFFGLLYQRAKGLGLQFALDGELLLITDFLEAQRENLFVLENFLLELVQLADRIERIRDRIEGMRAIGLLPDEQELEGYLQATLDLVQHSLGLGVAIAPGLVRDRYYQLMQQSQSLYRYLSEQAYTEAVLEASALLQNLLQAGEEFVPGFEYDKKRVERIAELLEYGLFMANMVQASSAAEVEAAIGNAALPAGSSAVKKSARLNVAVQSYLGAYYRLDNPANLGSAWSDEFGLHAPIGIAVSRGFGRSGSLSLFGALLDLGAAVDYELRIGNDPVTGDPVVERNYTIELGQILSPGAYLVYGAPFHLPLSLGVGGQYGPGLARVEQNTVLADAPSWRWQVFLGVDIPFFNLWSRGR